MKEIKSKSGKTYVYNIGQMNYYLQRGLIPLQIGQGKLGDVFAVFDYEEHKRLFGDWITIQSSFKMVNLHGE